MKILNKLKYIINEYRFLIILISIIIILIILIILNNSPFFKLKINDKMTKLSDFELDKDIFITSNKIYNYCKGLNKVEYVKVDFIKNNYENDIIHIDKWNNGDNKYDININDVKILVSGHSDLDISNNELEIINKQNINKWFSTNMNIRHPKCIALPLGITNKDEKNSEIHKIIGNTDTIYNISKTPKNIKNLVYLNISIDTYPQEREIIYEKYKNKSWVTTEKPTKTKEGHSHFMDQMYSHKFVFSPRGNGIDTHRMWESLYLRSIPIVKKCLAMEQFYDLPILFVEDWDNITEDYLNNKYIEIMNKEYPLYKLNIDYWKNMISNI
jgi:hypothetical protein